MCFYLLQYFLKKKNIIWVIYCIPVLYKDIVKDMDVVDFAADVTCLSVNVIK
jgi:hypothetical protein